MTERIPLSHYGRIELGTVKTAYCELSDFFDSGDEQDFLNQLVLDSGIFVTLLNDTCCLIGYSYKERPRWTVGEWEGAPYIAASYEFIDENIIEHTVPAHTIKTGEYVQVGGFLTRLVHQNTRGRQVLLIDADMPWFWLRILYHRLAYATEIVLEHLGFLNYD